MQVIEEDLIRSQCHSFALTGVQKADNSYTCPILEIHTWRKEVIETNLNKVRLSQRMPSNTRDDRIGPLRGIEHRQLELDEEIQCIPIESILSIKYTGEIRKQLTEQTHAVLEQITPRKLSCGEKFQRWCCCKTMNNQVHTDTGQTISQIVDEKGERVILMTIEYIRYNHINSPSYFNVLPNDDAMNFYREHFHQDVLKFYLLNNHDFDRTNFDVKRAQGATFCRLVTQLKAMVDQYPNDATLETIIRKQEIQAIGDPLQETLNRSINRNTTPLNELQRRQN